ncbi:probable tRNA methyltransferase 9B [Rhinatrema bivittatum]|uniref:probable tRNA methyltransferase 9B n=1 Tax=Rhinatrema bivittatum TaxID=194408 RepID=UPI00112ED723|nr:probable tRNA methyltransferase 9B [Rhinatrema bivittatum]XP_029458543.1 probable tRNA methyltransferase 9B [Rhinatrema bivittatum]XP_029458544.1 probable tRNA methyltransferase 9B [Rhinatrema bivittatum]XP_029458545.1 probable tRNA methyltransferase 9B [Rhinatrema bivittatum]XP_029458546.1 probable tRNA methyltransferase 9B [Rhinatrema bivittatum]
MEKEASELERDHVHSVYERIAPYFNDIRYKAWPKVQEFLLAQEPGSLIADIGCGNGKYLHINSKAFKVGCDYCLPLAESARKHGYEIMVCDSLCLPYRKECFDAVLSIAVIHHLSTKERRIRAIKEMARILRVGGQIMIYVWAMEQKRRKFEKQDIFVPWHPAPPLLTMSNNSAHAVKEPMNYKHRKQTFNNQHSRSIASTSEMHRKERRSSFMGEKETLNASFEKSLRLSFSRSLDSVLDFSSGGSQQPHHEPSTFHEYSIQLNELCGEQLFEQSKGEGFMKHVVGLFPSYSQCPEYDAVRADSELESSDPRSYAFRSSSTELGSDIVHPHCVEVIRDCSKVSLPDLVSHHKGVAVRKQPKPNSLLKQTDFYKQLNKSRRDRSLQGSGNEFDLCVQNEQESVNSNGACLRYYHVFRKGELVQLIEQHIPELHVVEEYCDHANWCVIAERVQVWNI